MPHSTLTLHGADRKFGALKRTLYNSFYTSSPSTTAHRASKRRYSELPEVEEIPTGAQKPIDIEDISVDGDAIEEVDLLWSSALDSLRTDGLRKSVERSNAQIPRVSQNQHVIT